MSEEVERAIDGAPSARLIREAIDEARDLVRLEVALAREELGEDLGRAKGVAAAMSTAAVLGIAGFTMLVAAIALAAGGSWLVALLLGAGLLVVGAAVGVLGWRVMPTVALPTTRERVGSSLRGLRERIA
jgi:hypothetical protein